MLVKISFTISTVLSYMYGNEVDYNVHYKNKIHAHQPIFARKPYNLEVELLFCHAGTAEKLTLPYVYP